MIKEIIKNRGILSQKSEPITDKKVAQKIVEDLTDTLLYYEKYPLNNKTCCGLSAIQIGDPYRIMVIKPHVDKKEMVLCNPIIFSKQKPYKAVEGCMSFDVEAEVERFECITVAYYSPHNLNKALKGNFTGFTAQVIQHEIDHFNGSLI